MDQKMNWMLAPPPDGLGEEQWAFWDDAFTDDDLQLIIDLGDSCDKNYAVVGQEAEYLKEIRHSLVSFMTFELILDKVPFLLYKLDSICRKLNGSYFGFDLTGFHEPFQYTTYVGDEETEKTDCHTGYTWHMDKGPGEDRPPRKLSMILSLMDSEDYEGGDFEIKTGIEPQRLPIKKGRVIVFPSWTLHRVTPVTKGIRRSIVVWVGGPKFR